MSIRTVIVDDEPLAREGLRGFLTDHPDVEIVGECGSGKEAVRAIEALRPDLVFLDIQMPELDGFGVLRELGPEKTPAVVFVTAHDEYAIDAFEVVALDYLLKPVERARFERSLERARAQLGAGGVEELRNRVLRLLDQLGREDELLDRIVVKSRGRVSFVSVRDIRWIEAEGNYARLHVSDGDHLIRETMASLERRLDPKRFARVHRSAIVNLDRVREIQPWFKGDLMVILDTGEEVALSRKYRKKLRERLGQSL